MPWTSRRTARRERGRLFAAVLAAAALTGGCHLVENPFVDETIPAEAISTPSADGFAGHAPEPQPRQRTWPAYETSVHTGATNHWPLWFEDSLEDRGSENGQFAWTWEDFVGIGWSYGRYLLNLMAFPGSAVVTPPWTVMSSDGVLSRQALGFDHDARPSPAPARELSDARSLFVRAAAEQVPKGPDSPARRSEGAEAAHPPP